MPREQVGSGDAGGETGGAGDDRGRRYEVGRLDDWQRIEVEKPERDRVTKAWDASSDPSEEFERAGRQPDPEVKRARPDRIEPGDLTAEQRAELEEMTGQPIEHILERRNQARAQETGTEAERPPMELRTDLPDDHSANDVIRAYQAGTFTHKEALARLDSLDVPPPPDDSGQPPADQAGAGGEAVDGAEQVERADRPYAITQPDMAQDYFPTVPPTVEERYFVRDQTRPIPVFDGEPRREQVAQGQIGDCGIVATLGAVAGHRPEAIRSAITRTAEGQYAIRLHEITPATPADPTARPTGNTITMQMNDRIPVDTNDPRRRPAGVEAGSCGWPALMEKTVAAQDQTWKPQQHASWDRAWIQVHKPAVDGERRQVGLGPSPRDAPYGYNRLDIGSTADQRTNLLAELTGDEAETRPIPGEQRGEQELLAEFRDQLADGKPILVGSRAQMRGEAGPYPTQNVFAFGHAYEVSKIENGRIHLRNPWGDWANPPPMDVKTFWEYYRRYNQDGSRSGSYSTLR